MTAVRIGKPDAGLWCSQCAVSVTVYSCIGKTATNTIDTVATAQTSNRGHFIPLGTDKDVSTCRASEYSAVVHQFRFSWRLGKRSFGHCQGPEVKENVPAGISSKTKRHGHLSIPDKSPI